MNREALTGPKSPYDICDDISVCPAAHAQGKSTQPESALRRCTTEALWACSVLDVRRSFVYMNHTCIINRYLNQ